MEFSKINPTLRLTGGPNSGPLGTRGRQSKRDDTDDGAPPVRPHYFTSRRKVGAMQRYKLVVLSQLKNIINNPSSFDPALVDGAKAALAAYPRVLQNLNN